MTIREVVAVGAVLASVLLQGCGASTAQKPAFCSVTPGPMLLAVRKTDSMSAASSETNRRVYGVLLKGSVPQPSGGCVPVQYMPQRFETAASWMPSREGGLSQDKCSDYAAPAVKLLDPLHPDALRPAIGDVPSWGAAVAGWVSWSVETRPDCELEFTTYLVYLRADSRGDELRARLASWELTGATAAEALPSPPPSSAPGIAIHPTPIGTPITDLRQESPAIPGVASAAFRLPEMGSISLSWFGQAQPNHGCILDVSLVSTTSNLAYYFDLPLAETGGSTSGESALLAMALAHGLLTPGGEYRLSVVSNCASWRATLLRYAVEPSYPPLNWPSPLLP